MPSYIMANARSGTAFLSKAYVACLCPSYAIAPWPDLLSTRFPLMIRHPKEASSSASPDLSFEPLIRIAHLTQIHTTFVATFEGLELSISK